MIETVKTTLFTNWHFIRWLRLGLGLFVGAQAIQLHDALSGFISFFLLYQALANTGCCGAGGCTVNPASEKMEPTKDVEFEEVKSDGKRNG